MCVMIPRHTSECCTNCVITEVYVWLIQYMRGNISNLTNTFLHSKEIYQMRLVAVTSSFVFVIYLYLFSLCVGYLYDSETYSVSIKYTWTSTLLSDYCGSLSASPTVTNVQISKKTFLSNIHHPLFIQITQAV